MGTHEPEKLLSLWASEQIDGEMAIGYDLQNAVKLHKGQTAIRLALRKLQGRVNTLEQKAQIQQTKIENLQTLIDSLPARAGIKFNRGTKKSPRKN